MQDVMPTRAPGRTVEFVAASSPPPRGCEEEHKRKRTSGQPEDVVRPPCRLARYVRTGRFPVLVADPRHSDIFSQSLTFDLATHGHMQADVSRCAAFSDALLTHAAGKVVLEIGTGPAALLAIMAARAGAARVYAVESDAASAEAARQHIAQLVLSGDLAAGQIVILEKFSTDLTSADLPESVQLVVHEMLGTFASSEGVRHFYESARRLLPPSCLSIPHRAMTMLAPGLAPSLELLSRVDARHTAIGPRQKYLIVGRCGGLPRELLLADAQPFEDVCFNGVAGTLGAGIGGCARQREEEELHFTASRDGEHGGYFAFLRFQAADGGHWVDSYDGSHGQSTSWAVMFLPLARPRAVRGGDEMRAICAVEGGASPTPAYSFDLAGSDGYDELITLSLSELYPLDGGAWCRKCGGTTNSVAEEGRDWIGCHLCGDAYHRHCRWDAREPAALESWACAKCASSSRDMSREQERHDL